MTSRILFLCLLATVLAYTTSEEAELEISRDINDCHSQDGDQVLVDMDIVDPGHYTGQVGLYVTYPSNGAPREKTINCIKVIVDPKTGGTAKIADGGRGQKSVTFRFESSYGKKAGFTILVYGQ